MVYIQEPGIVRASLKIAIYCDAVVLFLPPYVIGNSVRHIFNVTVINKREKFSF